tara:strand:- start:1 stop:195 length:195 start_codon:yes stop_codon:yes gene_type:complete
MKLQDFKNQMNEMLGSRHENIPATPRYGIPGKRSAKQIQAEIDHLQKVDTNTTNKVRATYSITK